MSMYQSLYGQYMVEIAKIPGDGIQALIDRVDRDVQLKDSWTPLEVRLMVLQAATEAVQMMKQRIERL